jgi:RHS repeat-associated protein
VGSNVTFSYTFDAIHQMLTQAISDGTNFQWHPSAGGTVTYGTASNLNLYPTVGGVAHTYNNNGCLTGDGTWTFGYNVESMLTTATKTGTSLAFKYDPNMRQVEKSVGATKTRFYYGGLQRLGDYSSAGALQSRYVYGNGMDEVLIKVTSAGVKTYYHGDHQGSVIAITSNTGAVTNRYKYSPFGESPSMTGTTHGYTGQRFDSESGLYYYKNRYYSPKLGRFLQPDPIGFADGLNLYTYVQNSPLNLIDPLGLGGSTPGGGSGGQPVGGGGGLPPIIPQGAPLPRTILPGEPGFSMNQSVQYETPPEVRPLADVIKDITIELAIAEIGGAIVSKFFAAMSGFVRNWSLGRGVTRVGEKYQSHADRTPELYPPAAQNNAARTKAGEEMIEMILADPSGPPQPWIKNGVQVGWQYRGAAVGNTLRGFRTDMEGNFDTFISSKIR